MKRRRHTPEQIIRKLREADRLLAEGHEVPEVCKQLEISEATYHRWRAQYGGMKARLDTALAAPQIWAEGLFGQDRYGDASPWSIVRLHRDGAAEDAPERR